MNCRISRRNINHDQSLTRRNGTRHELILPRQDKATSEGPKPPISEPPNLRARVEHVVQQTLARESG